MIAFILIAILLFAGMLAIDYFFQPKKNNQTQSITKELKKISHSVSVLGESQFDRCQLMPNDATQKESSKDIENNSKEGHNFEPPVPEEEENYDPEPMDIDVPLLERIDTQEESENEEEDEIIELFGEDAVIASGLSVDEMLQTNHVIENPNAAAKEEENAGRVLYQNKKTDIFEQMVSGNPVKMERIRTLMYIHEKKHGITEVSNGNLVSAQNGDLKNFDVSKYVR